MYGLYYVGSTILYVRISLILDKGTTLAIVMHELPHELGDFIVYKKLGLNTRQALGLNLFAAMISFGGLYTGLALASDTDASQWLLALVAGLFIYIPMVDVVSITA